MGNSRSFGSARVLPNLPLRVKQGYHEDLRDKDLRDDIDGAFLSLENEIDPGEAYQQFIVSLGELTPPVWARESPILLIWVQRSGLDGADTYTTSKDHGLAAANVGLLSADVHYRINKIGSEDMIPT